MDNKAKEGALTVKERRVLCIVWISALIVLGLSLIIFSVYKPVTISFIDIGQGDACLVQAGFGGSVLIDGGDEGSEYTLTQYLRVNNVRRLDAVFVSHFHDDHVSGIKALIESGFEIGGLYIAKNESDTETREDILRLAQIHQIDVHTVECGDRLDFGKAEYSVLWPDEEAPETELNNQSMVLKIEYKDSSVLMTGDIEKPAERLILERDSEAVKADVIKIAHHGSKTSSRDNFIGRVGAEYAVISAGAGNRYGCPADSVLRTLSNNNITVWRTDLDGTVKFTLGKSGIKSIRTTDKRR